MIYDLLDIKQLKTTYYHPNCDGQSKRTIRTVKERLKCYVDEDQQNWDEGLQLLALAINSSINETTGKTPFRMRFGHEARMPWDILAS